MKTWAVMAALPLTMCTPNTAQEPEMMMASAESHAIVCADKITTEKVRTIMYEALDKALANHIVHMFEVWMKDDRDQPARARNGIINGINAYIQASKGTASWTPMECSG